MADTHPTDHADAEPDLPEMDLPRDDVQALGDERQADAAAVASDAGDAADAAGKAAGGAAQLLKDGAARLGKEATDRARGYLDDGKARAGSALDEVVRMLGDAAGTVDEKLGEQYGQYARTAADKVQGFSEGLKAKELDDLIDDARGFVQKSPAIAIGTAAALGFVLVRMIQSGLAIDREDA